MTDAHKSTIEVYNKLGKKYLRDISRSIPAERPAFIKLLPKKAKILDVGCAGGRDAKAFVNKGFKVVGIDPSTVFIREARRSVPGAKFLKADIREIALPPNSFDAIWANAVLLHLTKQDALRVLKKFYSTLRSDGLLHVRVKWGNNTKLVSEKLSAGQGRLFTYFTKEELVAMCKAAGFTIIRAAILKDEMGRKNVRWVSVWGKKPKPPV